MVNFKKVSLVAIVLIAIGIVGSLITLPLLKSSQKVHEEKEFPNEAIKNIAFDVYSAGLEIIPVKNQTMKVLVTGESKEELIFRADVVGDTLNVELKKKHRMYFFTVMDFVKDVKLQIFVPENEFESIAGNVKYGGIHIENLKADQLDLELRNGLIELSGVDAQNIDLKLEDGEISLDKVEGNIRGTAENGIISLKTAHLDRNIDFEMENGEIMIQTEQKPNNATIHAGVDNGAIIIFGSFQPDVTFGKGENKINLYVTNGTILIQ